MEEQHGKKWLGLHILNSRDIVLSITQATERRYLLARSRVAIGDLRDSLQCLDCTVVSYIFDSAVFKSKPFGCRSALSLCN